MKSIVNIAIMSMMALVSVATAASPLSIKIHRATVPNGTANEASFSTHGPVAYMGASGSNLMTGFGAAMSFQFFNGVVPVNVADFMFASASYRLVRLHDGVTTVPVPTQNFGEYNSGSTSRPYLVARNVANAQVSSNVPIVGSTVQSVSKFLVLEQNVPFNSTSRPAPTLIGDEYELQWTFTGTYVWEGVSHPFIVSAESNSEMHTPVDGKATAKVMVVQNLPGFTPDTSPSKPTTIRLFASNNLTTWVPVLGVTVPTPLPTTAETTIPLVNGIDIPGITKDIKLFLRFAQSDF